MSSGRGVLEQRVKKGLDGVEQGKKKRKTMHKVLAAVLKTVWQKRSTFVFSQKGANFRINGEKEIVDVEQP